MTPKEILRIRRHLGLTQAQLSHLLDVHALTVSKWECDRLNPSAYQCALLRAFDQAETKRPGAGCVADRGCVDRGAPYAIYILLRAAYEE